MSRSNTGKLRSLQPLCKVEKDVGKNGVDFIGAMVYNVDKDNWWQGKAFIVHKSVVNHIFQRICITVV